MLHPFKTFPKASERDVWERIFASEEKRKLTSAIMTHAEAALAEPVLPLTATLYMEFTRNGNRSRYEANYFGRRMSLSALVLAEILEHKGRFLDKSIDFIWAILGEPSWCLPAHHLHIEPNSSDPLPTPECENIDLFAAETGVFLAMVLDLMSEELADISPNLVQRIRMEILRRVLLPTEADLARYHWSRATNNWNPWICSNLLWTANVLFADEPARFDSYAKLLQPSIKNYYDAYPDDGGCDEGPGYWNLSPPKYFLFMEALRRASDGAISCIGDTKFQKMVGYIVDAWYEQNRNARFADCGGRHGLNTGVLRAMSEQAGVPQGIALADMLDDCIDIFPKPHSALLPPLFDLFTDRHPECAMPRRAFSIYPMLQQVFLKRDGLFIALKGGHNHESHNHNDVGQFVIGQHGRFTVLDLGSATYDQSTFSSQRYSNFPQSGLSHNPLVFNGIPQEAGHGCATQFEASGDEDAFSCRMEISSCYPASLGLLSYHRTFSYDGHTFTVQDSWKASTPLKPTMTLLHETSKPLVQCDLPQTTEEYPISDAWLSHAWGNMLYRTLITAPEATEGIITLSFPL
ncbi:MAG: heparinase II/III family protein [Victivallales bacterium]|nr:heparinase II/III family protein [Victivallales bacterium]